MNEKVNGYEINTVNTMNVRKIGGMDAKMNEIMNQN